MKGLLVGMLALAACGGGAAKKTTELPPPSRDSRAEIDRLDAAIAADLAKLESSTPAPAAMVEGVCSPATTPVCTEACTLKDSICANATKICEIAGKLGTDAYANDKCTRGTASCDAAKQRCCNCS